jgi:hypothetical protein
MSTFIDGEVEEKVLEELKEEPANKMIDFDSPLTVQYCPKCTMPPEYCQFGANFQECFPWIAKNCPEVLSEKILNEMMDKLKLKEDGGLDV